MGRGSSKTTNEKNKDRRFYTFTLNVNKPEDKELIDFLELRSTTATVKTALKQLREKELGANASVNPADLAQVIAMLSNFNGTDATNLLKKENSETEQAATVEEAVDVVPEERKEVVSAAKKQAFAGLDNAF